MNMYETDLLLEEHLQGDLLLIFLMMFQKLLKILVHFSLFVDEGRVPIVLDRVVTAAKNNICDFCPVIIERLMK